MTTTEQAPSTPTIAEQISALLDDDGQRWTARDGRDFDQLVADHGGATTEWRDGWHTGDTYRLVFRDGSIITVAGDAWDFGFADCWCWEGAGHNDDCTATEDREEEEQVACVYCGEHHSADEEREVPRAADEDAWARLAASHMPGCEWITTRAHQLAPREV